MAVGRSIEARAPKKPKNRTPTITFYPKHDSVGLTNTFYPNSAHHKKNHERIKSSTAVFTAGGSGISLLYDKTGADGNF